MPHLTGRRLRRTVAPVARFLLLIFLVTLAVFMMMEMLPGGPVEALLGPGASPEQIALANEQYGFNDPMITRYFAWLGSVVTGDFGQSFASGDSVTGMILERAPVTLELAFLAMLVALVVSVPVGVWSAYRPGGVVDRVAALITSALLATPAFVLGIVLAYLVGVKLGWVPPLGYVEFASGPVQHFRSLVLPVLTLAAGECVMLTRLLRGDMLTTLQQDHVLAARARGLPTWRILTKHSLRQSSFSLVTVSAVMIGRLIGGTLLVETIFSIPGLGMMVITALNSRDYVVIQAFVLLAAVIYVVLNTLVDLSYPLLDPRVRKGNA